MTKIKIALIGCGRIAKRHSELLGNSEINGAGLACVCDLDETKAMAIGEKFKVPYYADFHEMMKHEDVDCVTVLTESGAHAQNVIELATYGKHILVEKPSGRKFRHGSWSRSQINSTIGCIILELV